MNPVHHGKGHLTDLGALYAAQAVNWIVPLALIPFLVRTLGLDAFGRLAAAQALALFVVVLVDAGINPEALRRIALAAPAPGVDAQNRMDCVIAIARIFRATQAIRLALALAIISLATLIVVSVPPWRADFELFAAALLSVMGTLVFPQWLFVGCGKLRHFAACSAIGRLASALVLVLVIRSPQDVLLATLVHSGGTLLAGVVAWPFIRQLTATAPSAGSLGIQLADVRAEAVSLLHASKLAWLVQGAFSMYQNALIPICGLIAPYAAVGALASMEKLVRAGAQAGQPFLQVLLPRAVRAARDNPDTARKGAVRVLTLLVTGGTLAVALSAVLGEIVLQWMFGAAIAAHAHWLPWLVAWMSMQFIARPWGQQTALAFGKARQFAQLEGCLLPVQFALLGVGGWYAGKAGLIFGLCAGEAIALGAALLFFDRSGLFLKAAVATRRAAPDSAPPLPTDILAPGGKS